MPGRKFPLITQEYYHVYNRGIDHRPTFTTKKEYERATMALEYYIYEKPPLKLSRYIRLSGSRYHDVSNSLTKRSKLVRLYAYCLMSNHFHILVEQLIENGIAKFLSNFQNSYTRYFNTRHKRDGSLFLDQFKAVHIETDEQLLHLSRYIHLNPYTGSLVKSLEKLEKYSWSSFPDYLGNRQNGQVETSFVTANFRNLREYKHFVLNQANYQKELKLIEHLTFEPVSRYR